jgi:hypothetical protein
LVPEPIDWAVVVAGAWNLALLTPSWLQRRLFERPDATVQLFMAVDQAAPPRFQLEQTSIMVFPGLLVVGAMDCTYKTLLEAQRLAAKALQLLSETPIAGVGVNVRYKLGDLPTTTLARSVAPLDSLLADCDLHVRSKQIQRTISFREGVLNLTLAEDEQGQGTVLFNFHLDARESATAQKWLGDLSEATLKGTVERVMTECLGLNVGGAAHAY